jgi:hypothetical protein
VRHRATVLALALLGSSCGGPQFKNEACHRLYDTCMNRCAAYCEASGSRRSDEYMRDQPQDNTTGSSGQCSTCIQNCRDQGERCEKDHALR